MTVSRRKFLAATGAALAAPAIARPAFAQAQVTLKLHHFLPPVSNGHAKMLAPWAKVGGAGFRRQDQDRHLSRRCSSAARRRSSTIRRATAWSTSSGRCPDRRRAASRQPRCSSCPSLARAAASSMRGRRRNSRRQPRQGNERHQAAQLLVARPRPDPRQQGGQDHGRPQGAQAALRRPVSPARR